MGSLSNTLGKTNPHQYANKTHIKLNKQEALTGWLFILPTLIGFCIFTFGSIIYSFIISFTNWDLLSPKKFIGLKNYINVFKDNFFWQCMYNTVYFVIALVPTVLVLSMALAIAVDQRTKRLSNYFKVSFFMPSVTSTVAISMVWLWIFNSDNGIANTLLGYLGVANPPRWLESVVWAKPSLVIMRVWQMCGYYMLLFIAGLQTIPDSLYEAAIVDGASKWQRTRHITIPMLSNTTLFVVIMLVIESFNVFEAVYVMTGGGPGGTTNTMLYYIYTSGFKFYKMGYASALAWILFAILFALTFIQFKARQKRENYV
ncbi:MAG TPA: sugar ABC transporter permease [Tepidanaerobacter syntrophicus]|uniref:carbohydrate ABC transporter permease n=1 Tax=Tepidanaerobacter syntrophicus TaxID=224999 RepID=UPI001758D230|nr:sugar ABC transporter permease [Tepidanaerobacter syntrophicus]HHV83497.1 sugar ABC transporter permease [Tepidanaerobacter syntrophicus]